MDYKRAHRKGNQGLPEGRKQERESLKLVREKERAMRDDSKRKGEPCSSNSMVRERREQQQNRTKYKKMEEAKKTAIQLKKQGKQN